MYKRIFYHSFVKMSNKVRTYTMLNDVCLSTQTLKPPEIDTGMYTSSLILTSTNYRIWATRMEVTLEEHDLWGVIDGSDENCKKDHLVLSTILNSILKY